MADFLWHKISDAERKKIEKESKELILSFGDALEKLPDLKEEFIERSEDSREEGSGKECEPEFRKLMFENASIVKDDCIVAEKGTWIEPSIINSSKRSQMKGDLLE